MKRIVLLVLSVTLLFSGCAKRAPEQTAVGEDQKRSLTVYAYDSFISDWGPGPQIVEGYENLTGTEVKMFSFGDAGQLLQRVISEKEDPQSDIIIGIDNNLLSRALEAQVFEPYSPQALKFVDQSLLFDPTGHLVPFDYGFFSIICNTGMLDSFPASLEDLTSPEYERSLILTDPRTSSPGLGFLLWTIAVYGDQFVDYWERLKPSILTIADGWDTGYGLFTNGEAPMVLSYTTSPAYHVEYEESTQYQAALFKEGHYLQIEGFGITRGTKKSEEAQRFVEYMLSVEAQSVIPLTNWMYPVREDVPLPLSYEYAPKPEEMLALPASQVDSSISEYLDTWTRLMSH